MSYQEILNDYLLIRKEANPAYSLRAFARDLDMASSNLSDVLRGKQGLSKVSAEKICKHLKLSDHDKNHFIDLVLAEHARSNKAKLQAKKRLCELWGEDSEETKVVKEDYFKFISEWYYFAILELITLDKFTNDLIWVSRRLDVELSTVEQAFERLHRLGLIKKSKKGYESTLCQLHTTYDIPSFSIKKNNTQLLKKAQDAIWEQSVDKRELSTLTTAISTEDLSFIKQEIRKFKKNLDKKIMKRNREKRADSVYCLSIQFFDLLKGDDDV